MKNEFIYLLKQVNRCGIEDMIAYIENSDFYSSPASTRYHGSFEGGLLQHSMCVYDNLRKIVTSFELPIGFESMVICGLLHDICKANTYKKAFRNKKNDDNGVWEKVDYYEVADSFPMGHGEKSVILIQKYVELTNEEMLAIRWHMGGFDDSVKGYSGLKSLNNAMEKYPLVTALQMADLAASYFYNR